MVEAARRCGGTTAGLCRANARYCSLPRLSLSLTPHLTRMIGGRPVADLQTLAANEPVIRRLHWEADGARDAITGARREWLVTNGVLPTDLVTRNRRIAEAALRPWTPVFTHGDLQITHVFVDADEIAGVLDWSEAGPGDALFDLATLTLGHEEHLGDVVAGYGTDVDLDVIRAWWSLRSLPR